MKQCVFEFHSIRDRPGPACIQVARGIKEAEALFFFMATHLSFPTYFGYNWDALDECIADLEWLRNPVKLWHEDIPLAIDPERAKIYLRVLDKAIREKNGFLSASFPKGCHSEIEMLLF